MSNSIPDFTLSERRLVSQTLQERYGKPVPVENAEAELLLDPLDSATTTCPSLTWVEHDVNFVIFKTGDKNHSRFRCQFYYIEAEQFGTGKEEYDTLGDCVITLLQVQSDHEREHARVRSGMNAVDFSKANDGEDYFAPIIV
ncbi:MAG: hypothetical protein Q7U85_01150 [Rhodocyclaceae bacterium]|nr:hypothetical protein [Rhodocyclaceae bacterium]